jgi:hypothetical protein
VPPKLIRHTRGRRQPYHPNDKIVEQANKIMHAYHYDVLLPLQKMQTSILEKNEIVDADLKVFHKAVQYIDKSIEKLKPLNTHNYNSDGGRRRTRRSRR